MSDTAPTYAPWLYTERGAGTPLMSDLLSADGLTLPTQLRKSDAPAGLCDAMTACHLYTQFLND